MNTYRISLHEQLGDKFTIFFDCYADDADHADEQAIDAYPGCEITHTMPIPECDYFVPPEAKGR